MFRVCMVNSRCASPVFCNFVVKSYQPGGWAPIYKFWFLQDILISFLCTCVYSYFVSLGVVPWLVFSSKCNSCRELVIWCNCWRGDGVGPGTGWAPLAPPPHNPGALDNFSQYWHSQHHFHFPLLTVSPPLSPLHISNSVLSLFRSTITLYYL